MIADLIILAAIGCIVVGLGGFFWNIAAVVRSRQVQDSRPANAPGKAVASDDRVLYERALVLVRENRISDGARILEELGLAREASSVLERGGMVHEAAGVFFRRKRYHRAGEVYARHKMWEQAGHSYLLAAQGAPGAHDLNQRHPSGGTRTDVKDVDMEPAKPGADLR
ncbi:MAG: hypothetical protein EBU49_08275 [Proteobacteria bacterium]|nr:hypothetical protein [Pseudomonadota bacterium]